MSILTSLFGGGASAVVDSVGKAVDSLVTSDEERLAAQAVLEKLRRQPHVLQAEINKLDSKSKRFFQAGWRPSIGWTCSAGLFITFVGNPVYTWITGDIGPEINSSLLMDLVLALLGLGGLRTFEKVKGVA